MSNQSQDFYNYLGISKESANDEIRKAYLGLAKQKHPVFSIQLNYFCFF